MSSVVYGQMQLLADIKPTCEVKPGHPYYGKHVVVSGNFANYRDRSELWQELINLGIKIRPSKVTKDTALVITGDDDARFPTKHPSGLSLKVRTAIELGIKIIGEEELEEFLSL